MLRVGIVPLLVATIALASLACSTQAAEVGECVKLERVEGRFHGHYVDKNCQVLATPAEDAEGKHNSREWSPGVDPAHAGFKAKSKTVVLRGAAGTIECRKASAVGEWTGAQTGTETITLEACEEKGTDGLCNSAGQAPGTIVTNPLEIALRGAGEESFNLNEKSEAEPVTVGPGEVWEQLRGPGGELDSVQLEYECSGIVVVRIEGSLAGPLAPGSLNLELKKDEVAFGEGKGAEGQSGEATVAEGEFFPVGKSSLAGVLTYTNAGKVEFRP